MKSHINIVVYAFSLSDKRIKFTRVYDLTIEGCLRILPMSQTTNNTLMLGNGFNHSLFSKAIEWKSLYDDNDTIINDYHNNTLLYEMRLIQEHQSDNQYKRNLVDKLRTYTSITKLKKRARNVDSFGELLQTHGIQNIITTNYDKGIENILCYKNGYVETWPDNIDKDLGEKIYSIRRNILLKKGSNVIKVWKIHGDIDSIPSISLGFDQYCGSIAKIDSYLKGKYHSSTYAVENSIMMQNKCESGEFSDVSWIDLFFSSNVYIACFGMDFSEIDIWWLINKRSRFIRQGIPIKNRIVYLYNEYDTGEACLRKRITADREKQRTFSEKIISLKMFGVECRRMESGVRCIPSLFEHIDL